MTAATLVYLGKHLSAEPSNISLLGVAHQIRDGQPVYVCLQPGDQTRYDLLIVPFSAIRGNPDAKDGLPTWDRDDTHLVVTRLVNMRPMYSAVVWRGCWDGEHRALATYGDGRVNEWTHELLTWWFARLWELVP